MKAEDIDAMLVRHTRTTRIATRDYCVQCGKEAPCDAVTAGLALRDALAANARTHLHAARLVDATAQIKRIAAERDAAEAKVRAVLALCDEAEPTKADWREFLYDGRPGVITDEALAEYNRAWLRERIQTIRRAAIEGVEVDRG